jgi:thiol-disulfide isomerase/thioredoxin
VRRTVVAALLATLLLPLAGCAGGNDPGLMPGTADVDVDTPHLRALKKQAGVEDCRPGDGTPVDGGLPEVTLPCFGGGPDVDLASLRGPMVVSLWASWCGPCRREMPVLQSFHERYAGRVDVVGVDYQDPQTDGAMALVRKTGATYPLLADPQGDLDRQAPFPHLAGLPFVALVDADGKVVHQEFTVLESEQQLVDLVHEHLGVDL